MHTGSWHWRQAVAMLILPTTIPLLSPSANFRSWCRRFLTMFCRRYHVLKQSRLNVPVRMRARVLSSSALLASTVRERIQHQGSGYGVGVGVGCWVGVGVGVGCWVGVGVGAGCWVGVGVGFGRWGGILWGGILCGPPFRHPFPLCGSIEIVSADGPSSVCHGNRFILPTKWAKLIPPTELAPSTAAVPTASSVTSFLRPCCEDKGRERGSDFARLTGERWADVSDAGGGVRGLPDVAAHRANGSMPSIVSGSPSAGEGNAAFVGSSSVGASGCVPTPGSITGALPAPFWGVDGEGSMPASSL